MAPHLMGCPFDNRFLCIVRPFCPPEEWPPCFSHGSRWVAPPISSTHQNPICRESQNYCLWPKTGDTILATTWTHDAFLLLDFALPLDKWRTCHVQHAKLKRTENNFQTRPQVLQTLRRATGVSRARNPQKV